MSLNGDVEGLYGDQNLTAFCHGGWLSVDRGLLLNVDFHISALLFQSDFVNAVNRFLQLCGLIVNMTFY
jgi:hypothetical protein